MKNIFERIKKFLGFSKDQGFDQEAIQRSIEDYKNRVVYEKLSEEILKNNFENDLDSIVLDNLFLKLEKSPKDEFDEVSTWREGQKAIYATFILESEVLNGGFNQFYFNSSRQFFKLAENGFKELNSKEFLKIVTKANSIYLKNRTHFENSELSTEEFVESYIDNPLNKLDDEFYDQDEIQNVKELRIKYIKGNVSEFKDN